MSRVIARLTAVFVTILFVLGLTGCRNASSDLVGRWRSGWGDLTFVFNNDGTGTVIDGGFETDLIWSTNDGRLTVTHFDVVRQNYLIGTTVEHLAFLDMHGHYRRQSREGTGLVGTWVPVIGGSDRSLTFNANGTGNRENFQGSQPFTWSTGDGRVSIMLERARGRWMTGSGYAWFEEREEHSRYLITNEPLRLYNPGFAGQFFARLDGVDGDSLIGTWVQGGGRHLSFHSDETGVDDTREFTWTAAGGVLTRVFERIEDPVDYAVDGATLTIFDRHGSETFTRVGDGR